MKVQNKVIFQEVQRPRQRFVWVLVIFIAAIFWYIFIKQIIFGIPAGNRPASDTMVIILWLILGWIFPVVILRFFKLTTNIEKDKIYIRFIPFHLHERIFSMQDLEEYEIITYNLLDFGGWGIRMTPEGDPVYNMHGKYAIKLKFTNKTIVIGTQQPIEFQRTLDTFMNNPHKESSNND